MLDFIVRYWVQYLFGLLAGGFVLIYKKMQNTMKANALVKDGIIAMLHDRLLQKCNHQLKNGYTTFDEIEEIEYMNRPYKALGGNGTVQTAIEKVKALPIRQEEKTQ